MKAAIEERLAVDPSGEIVEFKAGGCPWKEHLYDLEAELKLEKPIKFCIYEVCTPPELTVDFWRKHAAQYLYVRRVSGYRITYGRLLLHGIAISGWGRYTGS